MLHIEPAIQMLTWSTQRPSMLASHALRTGVHLNTDSRLRVHVLSSVSGFAILGKCVTLTRRRLELVQRGPICATKRWE
jgi:hypothetical protein